MAALEEDAVAAVIATASTTQVNTRYMVSLLDEQKQ
jgi:hypothetical protein